MPHCGQQGKPCPIQHAKNLGPNPAHPAAASGRVQVRAAGAARAACMRNGKAVQRSSSVSKRARKSAEKKGKHNMGQRRGGVGGCGWRGTLDTEKVKVRLRVGEWKREGRLPAQPCELDAGMLCIQPGMVRVQRMADPRRRAGTAGTLAWQAPVMLYTEGWLPLNEL